MVKADLTRDYYADLGLQPGASDAEIKKQFRQLGTNNLTAPVLHC
jgi:DnaJ-class molecular chaperone